MHLLDRIATRDFALIAGANLIPLLGVMLAGWDAFTLLMLYWFESAVIGLWVCVAVAMSDGRIEFLGLPKGVTKPSGIGMALFILAHAGIFMFVHLFFLMGFTSVASSGLPDGVALLTGLLFDKGLWLPLAGLFLFRGLVTLSDKVAGRPIEPVVVGFYLRIIVMQFVILFGGFFAVLAGTSIIPLLILIVLRAAIDLGIEPISQHISTQLARAREATAR